MNKKYYQAPELECINLELSNVILDSTQDQHGNQEGQQLPKDESDFPF